MDTDGDGCVSAIEVMNWLIKNGVESDFRTVAAIMKYFDSDGDGHITLDELISIRTLRLCRYTNVKLYVKDIDKAKY